MGGDERDEGDEGGDEGEVCEFHFWWMMGGCMEEAGEGRVER